MEAGRTNGRQESLDSILPSKKRGGRSFGTAPSEVHRATTLTSSTGLAAGHTMSCRPIGGSQGSGRWRQPFGARVMALSGL